MRPQIAPRSLRADGEASIFTNEPIAVALKKSIPVTLELATLAIILGLVVAIPIGVLSATHQDKLSDNVGRVVAVSGLSLPDFWLATLVITFAAIWFNWISPPSATELVGRAAQEPPAVPPPRRRARVSALRRHHAHDALHRVLSRIIYGARISLWVGLLAVGIGTLVGLVIGLACRYWEGRVDMVLQRIMDAVQAIPGLMLALAIVSVLKPSTTNAMLAVAVVIIPGNSRIVRGAVMSAKQNRYVEAAEALGCRQLHILASHILPNVTAPILIVASICSATRS